MRIAYVANHGNTGSDDTEGHIAHALRSLGHDVTEIYQGPRGSPAGCGDADLVLFHHWYNVHPGFLESLPGMKVCWYFDKVWRGRDEWVKKVAPLCTRFFMTDETWARTSGIAQIRILRQGIGERDAAPGVPRPDRWKGIKLAFTGSVYGERAIWAERLKKLYGSQFQAVSDAFNRDLYDLCATTPIVLAPPYPSDDHYWSNRIYLVLGSGGFLIHPRLFGLTAEFDEGIHYVAYSSQAELEEKIAYYLEHDAERRIIAEEGYKHVHERFNFTRRCQSLLQEIQRPRRTGMIA